MNSDKILSRCLALRLFLSCFESVRQITWRINEERFQLAENFRSARCSPFLISKVFAARMRKLITARARYTHCSHARKCSQMPFDTPLSHLLTTLTTASWVKRWRHRRTKPLALLVLKMAALLERSARERSKQQCEYCSKNDHFLMQKGL